ncbi:MAG: PKD domain-containing protein, partial [Bacteroidota bacterium]|nr:PKD domain-containing protein [Bacteroidota bacterium]
TSTLKDPSHNYTTDDTFTIKLWNTSDLGCMDSTIKTNYVFPSPLVAFDISDSQQCFNGNSFVFTNNSTINTGTQTYLWNFGDASTSNTTSPVHTYATDDTFTVFLIANSNLNCADTLSKTTYVFPNPNAIFSKGDSSQCFNGNHFNFINFSTINSGTQSFLWDFGNGTTSTSYSPGLAYQSDDTFVVKLLATSNLGCKDSTSQTIYIFPSPLANFSIIDSQQCLNGNNFTFSNNSTINSGTMNYFWRFGDSNSTVLPNHSFAYDDTFFVRLIVTSGLNCKDSTEQTAYVFPSPSSNFSINDSQQCINSNYFLFTNSSTITKGTYSTSWDFGDGSNTTNYSPDHIYSSDDTFSVKLVLNSNLGCSDSILKTTYVFPNPVADFNINDTQQCFNTNNFVFTNTSTINTGTNTYLWNFGDTLQSTLTNPSHAYAFDDTFNVKMITISNLGCKDSLNKINYVFPSPVPDFQINDSIQCFNGHEFNFTNSSTINTGSMNYLWRFGDGDTSALTSPTHTYAIDDTHNVEILITSNLGCQDSLTKSVYLFPSPVPNFVISDSQQCFNSNTFVFTNTSTINTGSQTYLWNFGDNDTSSQINPSHNYLTNDTFTVKLTINSNLNCMDSISKTVYVFPSPQMDFSVVDSQQCFNEHHFVFTNSSSINSGNMSYEWLFGDGDTSFTTHTDHNYTYDDTFLVKLKATSGLACQDSVTKPIYLFPSPIPDFSINDSSQCLNGNNFAFTNNSTINTGTQTYLWDFGDNDTSTQINPLHSYSNDDTFTVTLFSTSNLNCKDTIEKTAYVFPSPIADFVINDSTQCLNINQIDLTNTSSINSGSLNYNWSFGDSDSSSLINPSHNYSYDDTFTIELIAISNLNCLDSISKTTYIHPMPASDFSISDSTQCFNANNFVFTNETSLKWGSWNNVWDFGDNTQSTVVDPTHTYNYDDTFAVKLLTTSNMGCLDSIIKYLYVYPSPIPAFSINDSSQCLASNNYIFTNNSTINSGTQTYIWDFGDNQNSTTINPKHSYSNHDTFGVKLIITSNLLCKDSITKTVFVRPMPEADFSIVDSIQCFKGNNFNFTNASTIPYGTLSYLWDFENNQQSTAINPAITYTSDDTFNVKLIAISTFNCKDSIIKKAYVFPSPKLNFSINDSTQCLKWNKFNFTNLSSVNTGTLNYNWYFGDGDSSTLTNSKHSYLNYGNYQVQLFGISNLNCEDSLTKSIEVFPMPSSSFSINDSNQCLDGNNFVFNNLSTIPYGSLNYNWLFGDSKQSTISNPTHVYDTNNTYTVSLIATTNNSCVDTYNISIEVHPMPIPDFSFNTPCLGDTIYFKDLTSIDAPGKLGSWQWDFKNGDSSILQNPTNIYYTAGTYHVMLKVTSSKGCSRLTFKNLKFTDHVDPAILDFATVENNEFVKIVWTPSIVGKPMTFNLERSIDNNNFSNILSVTPDVLEYIDNNVNVATNSYIYRIQVTDSCNYISPYSNIGKTILLNIDIDEEDPLLQWTAYKEWKDGISQYEVQLKDEELGIFKPIHFTNDTFYKDTERDENYWEYCYRIIAHRNGDGQLSYSNYVCTPTPFSLWVPNAFTPNDDPNNPTFKVKGRFITQYNIKIYNRWGDLVYESNDIDAPWDGTYRNKLLPKGEYFYTIYAKGTKGQTKLIHGTVLLIR